MDSRERAFLEAIGEEFAKEEIAVGAIKKSLLLDEIAKKYVGHLPKKRKERILLRQTLYQIYFLHSIPLYAILNSSQELAKKYIHTSFAKFLNGALRSIVDRTPPYFKELHIRYSMPPFFIEMLIEERGEETALQILEAFEAPSKLFARRVPGFEMVELQKGGNDLGSDLYIQNPTPVALFQRLVEKLPFTPKSILDIAAAPGGKLLLAADCFPQAKLFGNDVSEKKLNFVRENLKRLGKEATLSCSAGEDLSFDEPFDLVICDLPCSNSGVFHKRAEARWRLTPEVFAETIEKQRRLIEKGRSLLREGGALFYMTCSLLKGENERIDGKFPPLYETTILPTANGWDGGYGSLII